MQHIPLGKTDLAVSRLGIGSLAVGETSDQHDRVVFLMNRLLDAGCNVIDTAQCYPGSEKLIGDRLAHRRDDYILVTKCGHHEILPDKSMRSRSISSDDIDGALTRLQTDVIDVMLLHSYDLDLLQNGEALGVLQSAKASGKVRYIGYSGDNESAQWAATHRQVDVIETSVNVADQANIEWIDAIARPAGIGVIAKKPLANAAWRCLDNPEDAHWAWRGYVPRLSAMNIDPQAFGCASMGELALRFTISVPGVHVAIASSSSEKNQDANIQAATAGPLPDAVVNDLRSLFQSCEQAADESWPAVN